MDVRIKPAKLGGVIEAIASKSEAHRLIICAALADGITKLNINKRSLDIDATIDCIRALGTEVNIDGTSVEIIPGKPSGAPLLDADK